jgi:hypothetical protein
VNERPATSGVKRRGFIGAGLVAAGAGIGALVRRSQPIHPVKNPIPSDSRFAYDVSEFEKTDPLLLRYQGSREFKTGFNRVTRIAFSPAGIWVAGDRSVRLFAPNGELRNEIPLDFRSHCLHAIKSQLIVGGKDFYVVFDEAGKERFRSPSVGGRTYFTSLRKHESAMYIADAANRQVLIANFKTGEIIDRFGQKDSIRNNPGFAIPSPYFPLEIGADNRLRIANTGQTRIETYTLDGRFESAWGEAGMQIDRFCGCCNPVYFTTTRDGNFITSEKGLCRINIYSPTGKFIGAVAGPETLVEDKELARRACEDCSVGGAFDVAIDVENNVFALDPFKKTVRCFAPLKKT